MSDYRSEFSIRRLWIIFGASMVVMFGALLFFGVQIYHAKPPIPALSGPPLGKCSTLARTSSAARTCGNRWAGCSRARSGATAAMSRPTGARTGCIAKRSRLRDGIAGTSPQKPFDALARARSGAVRLDPHARDAHQHLRPADHRTSLSATSAAAAIAATAAHYSDLFTNRTPADQQLRELYAMPQNAVLSADEAHALTGFIFWTAWATATERPGDTISYTSNWPHEPLVGNTPTGSIFLWTFISIFVLLGGIGGLVWYYAREFDVWRRDIEPTEGFAATDVLAGATITPSMRATAKYFFVVTALFFAPGPAGHRHRALRGRRPGPLRPADGRIFPLCDHPHLAHAARGAVDRDGLAGDRTLCRAVAGRQRTEVPAPGRQFPVRQPAGDRRRIVRRRMAGDQPPHGRRHA